MALTERQIELAIVATEASANTCQFGASLRDAGVDPLAREYLETARALERLLNPPTYTWLNEHTLRGENLAWLKSACRERDLKVSGKREELIQRLLAD